MPRDLTMRRVTLRLTRARSRFSTTPPYAYALRLDVEGEDEPLLVDVVYSSSLAAALRHLSCTAPRILRSAAAEVECGAWPVARKELLRGQ